MAETKMGRPTIYSDELVEAICLRLLEGESIRQICAREDMPAKRTFMYWMRDNEDFRNRVVEAREFAYDMMGDELLDIADDGTNDFVDRERKNGTKYKALDREHVQRSALRVDTRKWILSKRSPKKYGDRVQTVMTDPEGEPVRYSNVERARRLAFILKQAAAEAEAQAHETDEKDSE